MEEKHQSFEVVIRRKVPYVTAFLFHLTWVFALTLMLIYFLLLPTRYASDEIKTAYFILAIPSVVKTAGAISVVGLIIVLPIYFNARFYQNAILFFLSDRIVVKNKKLNVDIPINSIHRIYCMDNYSLQGVSREKLTIYVEQKDFMKTRIRLKNYDQMDEFLDKLTKYENVNLSMYDFDVALDGDPDEER